VARWAFVEGVEAAFSVGDLQVVRQQLTTAVQGFAPLAFPLVQAPHVAFQARLDASEGRHAEVARTFLTALAMFEQRQMPFWVAVTRLELGEWMTQRGRREEAEGLLGSARTASSSNWPAIPWIERVDAATLDTVTTTVDQHALPA